MFVCGVMVYVMKYLYVWIEMLNNKDGQVNHFAPQKKERKKTHLQGWILIQWTYNYIISNKRFKGKDWWKI